MTGVSRKLDKPSLPPDSTFSKLCLQTAGFQINGRPQGDALWHRLFIFSRKASHLRQ